MDDDTLSELNLTVRIKIPGSVPEKAQKDSKAKQGKGKDPSAEKFGVCPGYAVNAIHKRNEVFDNHASSKAPETPFTKNTDHMPCDGYCFFSPL
ncbi:hypothetical protein ACRRTK_021890 [Alexandromys fortis]